MPWTKSLQNSWQKLKKSNRFITAELQKLWKNAIIWPFSDNGCSEVDAWSRFWQGSLLFSKFEFSIKPSLRDVRQPIAVSDISIYICLIDIRRRFRSKSIEQLNERRAGLSRPEWQSHLRAHCKLVISSCGLRRVCMGRRWVDGKPWGLFGWSEVKWSEDG